MKNFIKPWLPKVINSGKMFSSLPNDFEVIRKDLFSIEFPVQMGIDERFIVEASRPKVTNEAKEVKFKNLSTWYKGKTKCNPITITFRDAIGVSVYQKLEQWQREHTDFATGQGGYAALYKKTLILNVEDPAGAVIQKFRLFGCFITELDGGDLNMDSDDIAQVKMTVQYDSYRQEF
jgi:hypothetical protein